MPVPVLITPATQKLLDAIAANGGGRPLIVGGYVRDAVLGLESKDVDIEVHGRMPPDPALVATFFDQWQADMQEANPDWDPTDEEVQGGVMAAVASAYSAELAEHIKGVGKVDLVGRSFGVIKVKIDDEEFDVSLPRRDSKVGAGHGGFHIGIDGSLDEVDAFGRRDFTINAMGFDPKTGQLVDPFGGLSDINDRMLRHSSGATLDDGTPIPTAFQEDPLRVLRGVQFAGRFGFDMDPETAELCRSLSHEYPNLAKERIWTEWSKIAGRAPEPSRSLAVLRQTGWDAHYPALVAISGVPQDARWHPEGDVETHTGLVSDAAARIAERDGLTGDDRAVVVFGAMAHDFGKATHTQIHRDDDGAVTKITSIGHAEAGVEPAVEFLAAIGAPEHIQQRIGPIVREHMCHTAVLDPTPSASAVRRLARRLAPHATIEDWARVVEADHAGRGPGSSPSPVSEWLTIARDLKIDLEPRKPLLTGDMLRGKGMRPTNEFKFIIADALEAQDAGEFDTAEGADAWFEANRETLMPSVIERARIDREEFAAFKERLRLETAEKVRIAKAAKRSEAEAAAQAG